MIHHDDDPFFCIFPSFSLHRIQMNRSGHSSEYDHDSGDHDNYAEVNMIMR